MIEAVNTEAGDSLAILLQCQQESPGGARNVSRQTLADLKAIDTNRELEKLISKHELTLRKVADICMVSYDTVASWTVSKDSVRWRRMPNNALKLLKMELGDKR